jgi:hypothetical protein
MRREELPKNYKGYPTEELLQIYDDLLADKLRGKNPPVPREKILAMGNLLREYKLAPVFQNR